MSSIASPTSRSITVSSRVLHGLNILFKNENRANTALVLLNSPSFAKNLHNFHPKTKGTPSIDLLQNWLQHYEHAIQWLDWLWNHSSFHVVADGAANHLRSSSWAAQYLASGTMQEYIPEAICGDLDSITKDTLEHYRSLDVKIKEDRDPDQNDLFKCLQQIASTPTVTGENWHVYIYGGLGGRLDQQMQTLNSLYYWQHQFSSMTVVTDETLAFLVPKGQNQIRPVRQIEGPICGLIPLGSTASSVTTNGLKWNLSDGKLEFGGLVSSSNEFIDDCIEITTDSNLLWTTELHVEKCMRKMSQ